MGDLHRLDELSLSMVLARPELSLEDLVHVQLTCKALRDFVQRTDAFVWLLKLKEDFDMPENDCQDYIRIYKRLALQRVPKILRFQGIFTNGSVDPVDTDISRYWVDNAFKQDSAPFCSVKGQNVDLVGVLLDGHRALLARERSARAFMRQQTAYAQRWVRRLSEVRRLEGEQGPDFAENDFESDQQLQMFFLALLESFEQGHGMGVLLFIEDDNAGAQEAYSHARRLRERILEAEQHFQDVILADSDDSDIVYDSSLIDGLIDGSRRYRRCVAERLMITRDGELTCPVRSGFVFGAIFDALKDDEHGDEPGFGRESWIAQLRRSLGKLKEYNDLLGLDMVMERCKQRVLPCIEAVNLYVLNEAVGACGAIVQQGSAFVEFERVPRQGQDGMAWSPIGMFIFNTSWVLRSQQVEGGEQPMTFPPDIVPLERIHVHQWDDEDSEEICVDLKKRRTINAVAMKMVCQENRMDEMNDMHEAPNIDLARLIVQGRRLDTDARHRYNTRYAEAENDDSC